MGGDGLEKESLGYLPGSRRAASGPGIVGYGERDDDRG
jgi:hypothetical protein